MKGALGLIAIAAVIWIFWMTKVHLTKAHRKSRRK